MLVSAREICRELGCNSYDLGCVKPGVKPFPIPLCHPRLVGDSAFFYLYLSRLLLLCFTHFYVRIP
jgi:hypothetical protein